MGFGSTHCTLNTLRFIHLDKGLERILFFVVRIYPQDLYPLAIVEVALPIGKRSFEELVDLGAMHQLPGNRVELARLQYL